MWVVNKIKEVLSVHRHLPAKLLLLALAFSAIVPSEASAQVFNRRLAGKKQKNLGDYDRQRFHFGFSLAVNKTNFRVKRIPDLHTLDSVFVVEPVGQPGFNLGIISDMRIGTMLNLRFIPTLSFSERVLQYSLYGNDTLLNAQKVESTFLEFPLTLKFKSLRINDGNWRAYLIGGGKFIWDLASQEKIEEQTGEKVLKLKKIDYAYEIGVGFDFYLEYFKLSPEIKVSFGLNDQLVKDGTIFTNSITSLKSKSILFSLHFE